MDAPSFDPAHPDVVEVPTAALAVVTGELSKRYGALDAETRSALATLTAALTATPPAASQGAAPASVTARYGADGGYAMVQIVNTPQHESSCSWVKDQLSGEYRCQHGIVMARHPNGWCDQGCCR